MKELILGGARSGKSRFAQRRAAASGRAVTFIATATAEDEEMRERIAHHRAERPTEWKLVEEPLYLARAISHNDGAMRCVIVDCLTLWLSNLMLSTNSDAPNRNDASAPALDQEREALLSLLPRVAADVFLVSNEVGMGIVPEGPLTRRFRDELGILHQRLAEACDRVTLLVAGIPMMVKPKQ